MSDAIASFRPVHCPDDADGRHYLGEELGNNCTDAHAITKRAADEASSWLRATHAALRSATLVALEVPHSQPGKPTIQRRELDPTSAHVVVELARFGSLDAPYLYVGLVAQNCDSVWHGVAGTYLPLCPHCGEGESLKMVREAAGALHLPRGTLDVLSRDRPAGLEPQDGWLEHRVVALLRLPGSEREPWRVLDMGGEQLGGRRPMLVRTGARLTAEPNLLYLEDHRELAAFSQVLFPEQVRPRQLSVRFGSRALLRRIAAEGAVAALPPRRLVLRSPRSRAPAGWSIVRLSRDGSPSGALLTRTATTLLRSMLPATRAPQGIRVEVWLAPRLSPGGAIDGTQLLALQRSFSALPEDGP